MRGQPIWTTDTHRSPRHSFKRWKKAGIVGLLVDTANPRLDSLDHGYVGFYGLQEKKKSLGNTLQLSLACWWDSPKTTLVELGWDTDFALASWSTKTEDEQLLCRENSGKAGLTSQKLEYG